MSKRYRSRDDDAPTRAVPGLSPLGRGAQGQRQRKVGEALRRALADILMRGETHDPELGRHSITVTEVRLTPDLRSATVFCLPLAGRAEAEALAALRANAGRLRMLVARAVATKYTPVLEFVLDESFDRMDAASRLLADPRVRRDTAPRPEGDDAEP